MFTRILSAAAVGALLLGVAVQPAGATGQVLHREYLTFSQPIAIPGVTLAAGTYTFEVPDAPFSPSLVRVRSRDGKQVYLTQFAREVRRPNTDNVPHVTFGEAAPGMARPLNTWYPIGQDSGRQFIYN